jgi:hypothetical protein
VAAAAGGPAGAAHGVGLHSAVHCLVSQDLEKGSGRAGVSQHQFLAAAGAAHAVGLHGAVHRLVSDQCFE